MSLKQRGVCEPRTTTPSSDSEGGGGFGSVANWGRWRCWWRCTDACCPSARDSGNLPSAPPVAARRRGDGVGSDSVSDTCTARRRAFLRTGDGAWSLRLVFPNLNGDGDGVLVHLFEHNQRSLGVGTRAEKAQLKAGQELRERQGQPHRKQPGNNVNGKSTPNESSVENDASTASDRSWSF